MGKYDITKLFEHFMKFGVFTPQASVLSLVYCLEHFVFFYTAFIPILVHIYYFFIKRYFSFLIL
jgi:hypothetical protein